MVDSDLIETTVSERPEQCSNRTRVRALNHQLQVRSSRSLITMIRRKTDSIRKVFVRSHAEFRDVFGDKMPALPKESRSWKLKQYLTVTYHEQNFSGNYFVHQSVNH